MASSSKTFSRWSSTELLNKPIPDLWTIRKRLADAHRRINIIEDGWSRFRVVLKDTLESKLFDTLMGLVIVFHMVLTVIETDSTAAQTLDGTDVIESDRESPQWIEYVGYTLLTVYSAEICLKVYVYRLFFFVSLWNWLDLVVVLTDIFISILQFAIGGFPSIAVIRVFRLARLARTLRILKEFRELYIILHSMIGALKAIFWACILLSLALTIISIVFVEVIHPLNLQLTIEGVYDDCERCPRAYESVFAACHTLFTTIVTGDSWGQYAYPLIERWPWTAVLFCVALMTVGLGLLNLVLTVIVDRANDARAENEAELKAARSEEQLLAKSHLDHVCSQMDTDGDGLLTLEEILEGAESNPEFIQTLKVLEVKRAEMATVFAMLDEDRSGTVTYEEFTDNLHRMKTQDDHAMLVFLKHHLNQVKYELADNFDEVGKTLDDLAAFLKIQNDMLPRSVQRDQTDRRDPSRIQKRPSPKQRQANVLNAYASADPLVKAEEVEFPQEEFSIDDAAGGLALEPKPDGGITRELQLNDDGQSRYQTVV